MQAARRSWFVGLVTGAVLSAATLAWLGYQAVAGWQRSATLLAERRAEAAVDLLLTAITRDMRGVQRSVLSSLRFEELAAGLLLDLNGVGSAFARYPYPEAFFVGGGTRAPGSMTFYSRADRPPPWLPRGNGPTRFPVVPASEPRVSRLLLDRIGQEAAMGRRFASFDVTLEDLRYQVVALVSYTGAHRDQLETVVGFLVNLQWVRENYFRELAAQVARIPGANSGLRLEVLDARGLAVVGAGRGDGDAPSSSRRFPLLFFDPGLVALDPPDDLKREAWTARATVAGDPALIAARRGARRTLSVAVVSTIVLAAGFGLTLRAARANARLVAMRSDFVSAVTHELKMPIATIRAICQTLASGRSTHPEMSREYAQLGVHEAKRLTRLIDNLLAYARITDVTEAYAFEPVTVGSIVQQSLKEFDSQLAAGGFAVQVDVPAELPAIRADRASMVLAIDNLLDNAIRYSTRTRRLTIAAHPSNGAVVIEVADAGMGIPETELQHVTQKFFRGSGAVSGGSGLGLYIAKRIVSDHDGTLSIRSEVGVGTTVTITLPGAEG